MFFYCVLPLIVFFPQILIVFKELKNKVVMKLTSCKREKHILNWLQQIVSPSLSQQCSCQYLTHYLKLLGEREKIYCTKIFLNSSFSRKIRN